MDKIERMKALQEAHDTWAANNGHFDDADVAKVINEMNDEFLRIMAAEVSR